MPVLTKLTNLEKEASAFGFKWENPKQIVTQIQSECDEINEHLNNPHHDPAQLQEEIGDLLHAVFSLCVFCHFDPQKTLKNSVDKFERRFAVVKQLANEAGLKTLQGQNFDKLMELWNKAKEAT